MLKQTPLNALHRAAGARMVDFGGWEMPLHYGSQIQEHHSVRNDAGMFDVSHMQVLDLNGDSARDFLRQIMANNVDRLILPGKAMYSCMLNEHGGVIDDLIIYFMRNDWFRIVVNAGTADKDIAWMQSRLQALTPGLTLTPRRDLAMIAIQGPNARAKLWAVMPGSQDISQHLKPFQATEMGTMFIARTGYTGEDGFEVMLPGKAAPFLWQTLAQQGVAPIGLGARDTLRLEAGMNLYGQDMDEHVTPIESGLAWTVDLASQRDFIGKQALVGQVVTRQLTGLVLQDKGVLRAHQKVTTAHGEGEITSGGYSPTMNQSIALARLPATVRCGETVQVEIRGRALDARVVRYPFVRNGKCLVA